MATATTTRPGRRSAGLLAACDDRRLFGFELWPRQRELLAAVGSGPRLHAWALGRRSGKTTLAALVGLWDCLLRPELDGMVRPGERRHAVCVATNLRQARLFVRAALSVVERSPLLARMVESASEDEILFRNRTALSAFPCSSRGARGWPVSSLLMDEAAHFITDTEGPAVADRVFAALVPATAQFGDLARIILASTPYGADGLFATVHAQATNGELVDALGQRASTAEMNPTITAEFLERERSRDPETFRGEYLAEFVGSGAMYLDPERLMDAVTLPGELLPEQATGWVAGLDPSFSRDPFGLALVGRDPRDRGRLLVGRVQAWLPRKIEGAGQSFEERRGVEDYLLSEVAAICKRYGARCVVDQHLAPAVIARLRQDGLRVRLVSMTSLSKSDAYGELRARLNAGTIALYEHHDLLTELRRLRTRYSAGSASVVVPRVGQSHGDLGQALALAVFEHGKRSTVDGSGHSVGGNGSPLSDAIGVSRDREVRGPSSIYYGMKF